MIPILKKELEILYIIKFIKYSHKNPECKSWYIAYSDKFENLYEEGHNLQEVKNDIFDSINQARKIASVHEINILQIEFVQIYENI